MRSRSRRVRNVGRGPRRAGFDAAHAVLTVTDNGGGFARVTTAGPHGLSLGAVVVISGNSDPSYNATHSVTAPDPASPTATTFDTDTTYDVNGFGGTWRPA